MESAVDGHRALPDEEARVDQTWLPFYEAISQETGVSALKVKETTLLLAVRRFDWHVSIIIVA